MHTRTRTLVMGFAAGAVMAAAGGCGESRTAGAPTEATKKETGVTANADAAAPSMLEFTMQRIDGTDAPLTDYKGKVVLVVNVASKCGLTPQYEGLEALYEAKSGDGLVILGFPANDFMGQEPGTNEEIAEFCSTEYGVTFPMFAKIVVTGDGAHPLFQSLTAASEAPSWNFTKYLVDRDGHLVKCFGPRTAPNDPEMVAEIDRLLAAG